MKFYLTLFVLCVFTAFASLQANAGPNRLDSRIQTTAYHVQDTQTPVDNGSAVGEIKVPTANTERSSLTGGGIYISGGALLVVILLLIILL